MQSHAMLDYTMQSQTILCKAMPDYTILCKAMPDQCKSTLPVLDRLGEEEKRREEMIEKNADADITCSKGKG